MLNILLMIILLIIILIFIILLIGIRLKLRWVKIDNDYDGCMEILIFKKLKVYTFNFKSDDDKKDSEDDEKRDYKEIYKLIKPCFKYFKKFLKDFLKAINVNDLENHLTIGFSNFAKTGEYIGYIWAILSFIRNFIPNSRLSAEPSFTGEVLNLKGHLNIDVSPLKMIVPIVKLISKKEIRALIKGVRNGNV